MASALATLFCLALLALAFGEEEKFTTQTNLEKLFLMESELLSLMDVFVREEYFAHDGEDVHNLGEIKNLTNRLKILHKFTKNMTTYLSHPINVLQLTRRFVYEWPHALRTISDSEPCQKWHIPEVKTRIKNIKNNVPSIADLQKVASSIARLQYTQNLAVSDLSVGVISGKKPYEPITIGDLVDIAWAAYEGGQFLLTTKLTESIIKDCNTSKKTEGCDNLKLYKMAAGAYFKINQLKEAVAITESILKKKPDDAAAKKNLKFYANRLKSGRKLKREYHFEIPNLKYYETCRGTRRMGAAQASRLRCELLPTKHWMVFEKAEFYNYNPPIFEIHQTFSQKYLTMIRNAGEQGFKKQAYDDLYRTPLYRHRPPPTRVYKVFSNRFVNLTGPMLRPMDIGTVEVRQSGMEGMYFKPKDRTTLPSLGAHIGSFFTFINEDYVGGEYVFPKYRVKIQPQKGNTVFFFATKSTLNICPVAFGSQWYAVQSLFEMKDRKICRIHDEDLEIAIA